MTYEELEALVLDTSDSGPLQRALAPLDEKARAKLSGPAQRLFRQLYQSKAAESASSQLKAILSVRVGGRWRYWSATDTKQAALAMFALCPISVVKKREVHVWYDHAQVFDQIIRDRRPGWLDEWIEHELERESTYLNFEVLRGWIRDGVCAKPVADGYYRMFAGYLMRTGFRHMGEVVPPITVQLLADPALLADVEGLFRVESIAFNTNSWLQAGASPEYETWTDALVKLSNEGQLDRAELLQFALDGLRLDLKQNQLSGFHGFYKRMAPVEAERLRHQAAYIDLLCHPVGHVVKFAIAMLADVEKTGALDGETVLRELPVVFSSDGKGNALAALKLLKRIIARRKLEVREALIVVGEALRHAHPDVQSLALDILVAHKARIAPEDLEKLSDMEPFLAASNRARFAQLFPSADHESNGEPIIESAVNGHPREATAALDYRPIAGDRLEAPILNQGQAITPIESVDALIEAVLHAVETVYSPDEVERIIDAISRLANSRPVDFDARVAPLLHRLKTGRGTNSVVLGSVGVGAALLDLLYTWLTGRLYRTPSEETKYYTQEDAFVPIRAHLRTITERIHRGDARAPLSTPTHKGGWIDPLVWVERLNQGRDAAIADSMDFRLSMLRLAPDHRAEALERVAILPTPLREIANFALGGEARPTRADRVHLAAWITAARCHDPYRDWSTDLAALNINDHLPDGIRPAHYVWSSTHKAHQYDKMRWKVPEFKISVTCEGTVESAPPESGMFGRIAQAFGSRTSVDWSQLPTVALNRRMEAKHYWSGELNSPWAAQWLSYIWPQNPAALCMRGVTRLMLRTDNNSSSWSPSHGYFQSLFQRGRPWREPGHLLLCLGLVGKDADARGLAIDALIEGIDGRLFDPELFASTIARLAEGEWIKFNRLGEALTTVIQVSQLHAAVVGEALQQWMPKLDLQQKNVFRLLEVLVEAQALSGGILSPDAENALAKATGTGKAAKIARQLTR